MSERLTNKKEADLQRLKYEKRLKQGYPRNISEERFLKLAHFEDLQEQGFTYFVRGGFKLYNMVCQNV